MLDKAPLNDKTYDIANYLLDHGVTVPTVRKAQDVYIHQFDNRGDMVVATCTVVRVDDDEFIVRLLDGRQYEMKLDYIGKTVFLTCEEAELALRRSQEEIIKELKKAFKRRNK